MAGEARGYPFASIEAKWQARWEEERTFRAAGPGEAGFDPARPKYYVLDMFPYPSGAGLHVGHPEGYTATDILARWRRMRGYNVLHPMGWDSFGLPAEQYAIQNNKHPSETVAANIGNFRRQIKALGFSYDWSREFATSDERYYRWTQWIFLCLWDTWYDEAAGRGRPIAELVIPDAVRGDPLRERSYVDSRRLAYLADVPVWWCEALGTVLANEEVIDGRSERGDHPCVKRPLKQWMLRITAYADRLIEDLDGLDWPESIKIQQREWIGRSDGAEIDFPVCDAAGRPTDRKIRAFTTRPDTLFGATYMVLAPEHPLVALVTSDAERPAVDAYRAQAAAKSDLARTDLAKEKTGVFTGAHAWNPGTEERIPIWIADYVLASYGTGAIMAVPAHDQRDFEFAGAKGLPIRRVVREPGAPEGKPLEAAFEGDGVAIGSPWFDGLPTPAAKTRCIEVLERRGIGQRRVTYRLRDWLFSRQRYWGEPFPVVHLEDGRIAPVPEPELPVALPPMDDFRPTGSPEPPLARAKGWVETRRDGLAARRETNTMPGWAGSCWYYLRFCDPQNGALPWDRERERYWMPVDLYVGGAEHAVLHLLYARFWHKVLYDRGHVSTPEPFRKLFNQGLILSFAYRTKGGAVVPVDEAEDAGSAEEFRHKRTGEPLERIVAKMSKSLKNVINPDDILSDYGADTFRLYEMFMGPLDVAKPWNTRDIEGVHRFLNRVWRLFPEGGGAPEDGEGAPALERLVHKTIEAVTDDLEQMAFNTAIARMMEFVNGATVAGPRGFTKRVAERFVLLLAPFAPHVAEELWERLGHAQSLAYHPWPAHDPAMLVEPEVEIAVQVNGKVRARLRVPVGLEEGAAREAVLAAEALKPHLAGRAVRKFIWVKDKLANLVVG